MIDFPDKAGTQSSAYYQNLLFGGTSGTLNHYYNEVSYGLLTVTGIVAGTGWYRSSNNMAWWGADTNTAQGQIDDLNGPIFNLAKEAVQKADADINFALYDTNGDGILESSELSICIVHAGSGQEATGSSTDIWSHRWIMYGSGYSYKGQPLSDVIVDGVRVTRKYPDDEINNRDVGGYFMQAEDSPLGTFAHEFGHDLGLPDLYDTDYSSDGIGVWGLMGFGSWLGSPPGTSPAHPIGWCKMKLGWITPLELTSSNKNIEVHQIETETYQSLYKLPISSTEYFLIENRQKTGYDSYLPGSGILIWHIDDSKTSNDNEMDRWVDLEEAHGGIQNLDIAGDNNWGDPEDAFYLRATAFTETTDPNSKSKAGYPTGYAITHISQSAPSMTFDLSLIASFFHPSTDLWFTWYDSIGASIDNIHLVNGGSSLATVSIWIGGVKMEDITLAAGSSTYRNYPGIMNGPVHITSNVPIWATQRIVGWGGFKEVPAIPGDVASTEIYYNWYDMKNARWNAIHFLNPNPSSTATVNIYIAGTLKQVVSINPGSAYYVYYPNEIGGPVKITSNIPIISTQRIIGWGSFEEIVGIPTWYASTEHWFNWYDKVNSQIDNIHIVNLGNAVASISIYIAGTLFESFTLNPGQTTYKNYANVVNGPVRIVSNQPIWVTQRIVGWDSFKEVFPIPIELMSNKWYFNWYDKVNTQIDNIHFLNPETSKVASIKIYIAGNLMQTITLGPGRATYVYYPSKIGGPVLIISDIPIMSTQRVVGWSSFEETIGIQWS